MSDDEFHVHGPHDHEIEHASHGDGHEGHGMTNQIAMFTAIIATVGAMFGYMGGATQANAGLYKNNAAISKTEASNQWNYYQAKSSKQNLSELGKEISPPTKKDFYDEEIKRYKSEKADIKKNAEALEAKSKEWDEKSDEEMHQHHRWAQATTALQISIALAAIALLTRKKWLQKGMMGMGALGLILGAAAALHY
jgi:Na+/glutamate symporter